MILLDTSVLVQFFRRDPGITDRLEQAVLAVPAVVAGELYFGAEFPMMNERRNREVDAVLARALVLVCGAATAKHYGQVKANLARRGQIIPENDMWIAATALEHDLPLATLDAHFDRVTGLHVLRW